MKLHEEKEKFKELIALVAAFYGLPEPAIERDYYIVELLQNLEKSEFNDFCIFKGGTSLSKCYPGSIERFSEDIDLTFLGMDLNNNECDKILKKIEKTIIGTFNSEKIINERNQRNKSSNVWFDDYNKKIKLEIGSQIKPDPYSKKEIKSYIFEYLEKFNLTETIIRYDLKSIFINTLSIERTFIDKVMAIKRHAICNNLTEKVRHIYDVHCLLKMDEIKVFLNNKAELKRILIITKQTDLFYLKKRNIGVEYNSMGPYNFTSWKEKFTEEVKEKYEKLHLNLLYTSKKQSLDDAVRSLEYLNSIFIEIDE